MANTPSAYKVAITESMLHYSICVDLCVRNDAEPALLSRCIEGSDVLNASGMHTKFTCVLWIYRSCPLVRLVVVCLS